jgi:hypothetical protein
MLLYDQAVPGPHNEERVIRFLRNGGNILPAEIMLHP